MYVRDENIILSPTDLLGQFFINKDWEDDQFDTFGHVFVIDQGKLRPGCPPPYEDSPMHGKGCPGACHFSCRAHHPVGRNEVA